MSVPRVSVVMPSFNQAPFLEEAVESVFAQGVDGLELVVMDGGSNDGTQGLLAALATRHAGRLRWHSGPDEGPASAVNAAVRAARAPIIGWLNSDDLYAPGAAARALAVFEARPETVMVYGEGQHVDAVGRFLERYPTLPPETPRMAWADGCPVCQPTAWFRRDAFLEVGGLDTSYRASFDYEFWLRLQARFPARTGFVDALQASTRIHAGTITSRFRERVALEGLRVVDTHLGPPPAHWLLTHFGELAQLHPFDAEPGQTLGDRCRLAIEHARPWLAPTTVAALEAALVEDARVRLSDAGFCAGVDADGWARDVLELRLRQPAEDPVGLIVLHAEHVVPTQGPLSFEVVSPDGLVQSFELLAPGKFQVEIPVADRAAGACLAWRVTTQVSPEAGLASGDDGRALAFRLTGVALSPS